MDGAHFDRAWWLWGDDRTSYVPLLIARYPLETLAARGPDEAGVRRGSLLQSDSDLLDAFRQSRHRERRRSLELRREPALMVMTFMQDSIWNTSFQGPFQPARVEAVSGAFVTIDGRRYLAEPESPAQVMALLQRPEGEVMIHRLVAPLIGAEALVDTLIADLRTSLRAART
jgi:hypothetical protein